MIAAIALLGACVDDEGVQQLDFTAASIQQQGRPEEVLVIYQELAARLSERGVALDELEAAVESNDVERVRELFDYTPEEFEAANARTLAVAAHVLEDVDDEMMTPEGWDCRGALTCAIGVMGIAYYQPQLAIGILAIGGAICMLDNCRYDGASPGTGTKRP